jgi:ubiquinone/menaquinone biosynthesis C-methylase UbiE
VNCEEMMPTFEEIYAVHADDYDRLVAREDYQNNILAALREICPLEGAEVVEFGAGTGRLTRLLAPLAKRIRAFDASAHMLGVAEETLRQMGGSNWSLGVAENKNIPVESGAADLSIEGWSFGHATGWYPDTWHEEIGAALGEMRRVLRPGGTAVLLETMTTGSETPRPPSDGLAAFYSWLEKEQGFASKTIRTDYKFESLEEADRLTRFFFGDELADRVLCENKVILPECTGIWWRRV